MGMSLFAFDLFLTGVPSGAALPSGELLGVGAFLSQPHAWRILVDLCLLAVCSGLFIVPLNTLIQQRAVAAQRSQVVAGANILSALFMVGASGLLLALFALGLSVLHIFWS